MKFSFVILHYNAIEETINCVDSIMKTQRTHGYEIVIVDNCSPDGSGKSLDKLYKETPHVKILHAKTNEGFARGNNIGFRYAKYEQRADFIILQNNDTLLLQEGFQSIVAEEYEQSHFAVLGPLIKTPHEPYNSNPGFSKMPAVQHYKMELFKYRMHLLLNYMHLDELITKKIYRVANPINNECEDKLTQLKCENVLLHGAFLVFSPIYINRFDGLNDKTFMFLEEPILYHRLITNGMKSVYLPSVEIFHKEDASQNATFSNSARKMRFVYKNKIHSLKVLIDEMEKKH